MSKSKRFEIKVTDKNGTGKRDIPKSALISDISFTENIDGGQGELTIRLVKPFDYSEFSNSDIIRVYVFGENFPPSGKLIYTGIIQTITRSYTPIGQETSFSCLPLSFLLSQVIYKHGASFLFEKSQDPSQSVRDIVDFFNTIYTAGFFSYTAQSIINTGSSVNIGFDYTDCLQSIKKCGTGGNKRFFIGSDGVVSFNSVLITHNVVLEKSVESLVLDEVQEELKNNVYVRYPYYYDPSPGVASGHPFQLSYATLSVTNPTSITNFGQRDTSLKTMIINGQIDLGDPAPTGRNAEKEGQQLLDKFNDNGEFLKVKELRINDTFEIETIHPLDRINIKNISYEINDLIVYKISYNMDSINIEIGEIQNLPDLLLSQEKFRSIPLPYQE